MNEKGRGQQLSLGNVVPIVKGRNEQGQTYFNQSALARELVLDRGTVAKRLSDVPANGVDEYGNPGWTLEVALPHFLDLLKPAEGIDVGADPAVFASSHAQDKYYAAQLKKLQLEKELGKVVPVEAVSGAWAEIVKKWIAFLQALPDQLERAAGLKADQVVQLERRIDELRAELYSELSNG